MSGIRIAIVKLRNDVLADTIAYDLREAPEFELVSDELIDADETRDKLFSVARDVEVLIAFGDFDPDLLEEIVRNEPHAVIASIVIGEDLVNFRLSEVGSVQLIETLQVLARDRGPDRSRLMEYRLSKEGHPAELVEIGRSVDRLIHEADKWVRATISAYAKSLPRTDGEYLTYATGPRIVEDLVRTAPPRRLAEDDDSAHDRELVEALMTESAAHPEPLARLFQRLGLTVTEFKVLLLALGPDLGVKIQTAFGHLNDDLGRKQPTLGLACSMLGNPIDIRTELEHEKGLVRWRLLDSGDVLPRADEPARLAQPLPGWLLGDEDALFGDASLRPFIRAGAYPGADYISDAEGVGPGAGLHQSLAGRSRWIVLPPRHLDRWRARCDAAAAATKRTTLRCQAEKLLVLAPTDQREATIRLARAAQLFDMVPMVDFGIEPADDSRLALLGHFVDALGMVSHPAVLIAADRRYAANLPGDDVTAYAADYAETEASEFYRAAAASRGLKLTTSDCRRLGTEFELTLDLIGQAVELAAFDRQSGRVGEELYGPMARACRTVASANLSRLVQVSAPTFALSDVILPAEQHAQLGEIVSQVEQAPIVLNQWGFGSQLPYGRGVSALFAGPSGTGKTMAAQGIAKALKTDLFTVDLSRVVSKYIGESEKNLDAVFSDAEKANAVLAFHEADSLFNQRSETKDAHDRYANLEVAYLLQRMESFTGLAILTTNLKQNIDSAFLRRLRFVIEFPKPDAAAREAIWRQCLPDAAPLAKDVELHLLAREIELSGGNIRQVTLRAAFAAASDGSGQIGMRHLFAATRAELIKLGRTGGLRQLDELQAYHNRTMAA
ncbi:ATP-binding protein [Microvirga splendida]|uniref:ATP-binding protein n=1 Tax=Microvirga splendida TaxID=2795727 RepID=A0ABS0Y4D8_9HYPH|nr:ATP-binding protein [Microvirga splendida]MBJ6127181.1 ATP-binding protein [Microvirga splendida]